MNNDELEQGEMMPEDVKTYTSEEEKIQAFDEIQNKVWTSKDDMLAATDEVINAEIVPGDARDKNINEPNNDEYLPQGDAPNQQTPEENASQETNATPPPEKVDGEQQTPDGRKFVFTEELLNEHDEEFYDANEQKSRNYFTHKTPEDFLKSYKSAQKKIHYDNDIRIPQIKKEYETIGYSKAEKEAQKKLDDLQNELKKYKELAEQKQTQSNFSGNEPQDDSVEQAISKLQEIDDVDLLEHGSVVKDAITGLAQALKRSKAQPKSDQIDIRAELKAEAGRIKEAYDAQLRAKEEALENERLQQTVYSSIDQFTHDPSTPERFQVDQNWSDVIKDAQGYNDKLIDVYTQLYPHKVTPNMTKDSWEALAQEAIAANLRGDPALVGSVNKYLPKPKNYDKWVEIGNLHAIKDGWERNPTTQEWQRRYDPATKQPVNFGDLRTAMNYYYDQSGEREKMALEKNKKDVASFAKAINKRANNITELSDQDLSSTSGEMTEEMANSLIAQADVQYIVNQHRMGNTAPYEQISEAFRKIGQEPFKL